MKRGEEQTSDYKPLHRYPHDHLELVYRRRRLYRGRVAFNALHMGYKFLHYKHVGTQYAQLSVAHLQKRSVPSWVNRVQ